eukprot:365249-Chlamydomonas_euryale.AAC.22
MEEAERRAIQTNMHSWHCQYRHGCVECSTGKVACSQLGQERTFHVAGQQSAGQQSTGQLHGKSFLDLVGCKPLC